MRFLNNYLKFNESIDDQFFKTYDETKNWLDKMSIDNYTINKDLTVDVDGNVYISNKKLKFIPVQFIYVSGSFECQNNELSSLKGCPYKVDNHFNCGDNKLTSLEYGPSIVNIHGYNSYCCYNNNIINLKGYPTNLAYNANGENDDGDDFYYNPIYVFLNLLSKRFKGCNLSTLINYINDYDVFVGNRIYLSRFKEALYMSDIEEELKSKFNIEELKDLNNKKDSFKNFKYIIID